MALLYKSPSYVAPRYLDAHVPYTSIQLLRVTPTMGFLDGIQKQPHRYTEHKMPYLSLMGSPCCVSISHFDDTALTRSHYKHPHTQTPYTHLPNEGVGLVWVCHPHPVDLNKPELWHQPFLFCFLQTAHHLVYSRCLPSARNTRNVQAPAQSDNMQSDYGALYSEA